MFHPKKERNLTLIIFYCSSRGQGSRIKPADLPPPKEFPGVRVMRCGVFLSMLREYALLIT